MAGYWGVRAPPGDRHDPVKKAIVWALIGLYGSRTLGEYWHTWKERRGRG